MNFLRSINFFKCLRPSLQASEADLANFSIMEPIVWFQPSTGFDDAEVRILPGAVNILDRPIEVPAEEQEVDITDVLEVPIDVLPEEEQVDIAAEVTLDEEPRPIVEPPRQSTATYLKLQLGCEITNESNIKSGAFGAVYFISPGSSHHPSAAPSDQNLALKIIEIKAGLVWENLNMASFRKEVKINQRIKEGDSHEHIVPFYGAFVFGFNLVTGKYEPRPFDPFLPGGLISTTTFVPYFGALWLEKCTTDLKSWMLEHEYEHLPEEISEQLFKQVGSALLFLHEKLATVHQDLKEANIAVLVNEATITFKLLDFGISQDEAPFNGAAFFQMEEAIFAKLLLELTWDEEEWDAVNPSTLKRVLLSMKDESMGLSAALAELPA